MKTSRIILAVVALVLLGIGVGGFAYVRAMTPTLELGVGYAARVACACRYIGNRTLDNCYKDFEPGMEPISLADDPATKTITASVPLIASRAARFDPVLGCQPEAYRGKPYAIRY
jgi:hypothetical protein